MKVTEKPRFESPPVDRMYRYVERRGAVEPDEVRDALDLDERTFHEALGSLTGDGYVSIEDGTLRIAVEAGDEETFVEDGVEYTVRPGRQEDFEGIVKVMRRIAEEQTYVVAETVAEQLLYEDAVIRHNAARSRLFFVATADDAVVGWTHTDTSPMEKLGHTAQQTIGVLEPYRGYGIGGRLMQRGLDWAVDHGVGKLYNSLPATNEAAIEFLEAHGWEIEAVRRGHYRIDGEFVDEVQMAVHPAEEPGAPSGSLRDASVAKTAIEDMKSHLHEALAAEDAETRRYHVRQALQFAEVGLADPD